ncbi:MAG TPA: hypothetical protein VIG38_02035 [Hyphomicrobium sp.]|jgi:hypothetical protein
MLSNHKADSFDGGRAASEPEQPGNMRELGLGWSATGRANSDDDDVRALALAIIALTGAGD